jgi:ATP-binding cassette subfamily B protein
MDRTSRANLADVPASARRWLVPEVVQTSAMDCGPASLTCLLEGFGIPASYGRIREACQTEVDGTSIDTLEEILVDLGFDAKQVLMPTEHVLLRSPPLLPALAVTRDANGYPHFVVVWRVHGPLVQVMDPAVGRRWLSREAFLRSLYRHTMPIPTASWRAWAGSASFAEALCARLAAFGVEPTTGDGLIASAQTDAGWRSLGALDAAARMVQTVADSGGIPRGGQAARLVGALFTRARDPSAMEAVPARFWTVRADDSGGDGESRVLVTSAVLVRVAGRRDKPVPSQGLSPELGAALEEAPIRPWRQLGGLLWEQSRLASLGLTGFTVAMSAFTVLEALVLRAVIDLGRELTTVRLRLIAGVIVAGFLTARLIVQVATHAMSQTLGRRLETTLRLAFLRKVARLGVHYFRSRPSADMAERVHSLRRLRAVPELGVEFLGSAATLMATTVGVLVIEPRAVVAALLVAAISVAIPLAMRAILAERELRLRTHSGALSQLSLDALNGLIPIRTHGAERTVRGVHEELLVEWRRAGRSLMRATLATEALGALAFTAFVAWLLIGYLASSSDKKGILLVLYFALSLGTAGQRFAGAVRRYPVLRNVTLRLCELLGAPNERELAATVAGNGVSRRTRARGAAVRFHRAMVRAGGHVILHDINLQIAPGAHVAVVGVSGAGKSSLIGLLVGLHRASEGSVLVDEEVLDSQALDRVRADVAWVDPAVRIWNESLLSNLLYGTGAGSTPEVGTLVEAAGLRAVLEGLPEGMQSSLGEGGTLVSGGEGQCVRLARALGRPDARLVLLDEPFRGLDVAKRRALLAKARAWWSGATLLCVTHDISETLAFPRVLVIDSGRVVEDGAPRELAARSSSRYAALLGEEKALRDTTWSVGMWRRIRMRRGRIETGDEPGVSLDEGSAAVTDAKNTRGAS